MAWARLDVRLPHGLRHIVNEQADRLGLDVSEYTRQALVAYTAWHRALDATDEHQGEDLRDPATIARLLGER